MKTKPKSSFFITSFLRSIDSFNPGPAAMLNVSDNSQNTYGGGCAYLLVVILFNYMFWTNFIQLVNL